FRQRTGGNERADLLLQRTQRSLLLLQRTQRSLLLLQLRSCVPGGGHRWRCLHKQPRTSTLQLLVRADSNHPRWRHAGSWTGAPRLNRVLVSREAQWTALQPIYQSQLIDATRQTRTSNHDAWVALSHKEVYGHFKRINSLFVILCCWAC